MGNPGRKVSKIRDSSVIMEVQTLKMDLCNIDLFWQHFLYIVKSPLLL